MFEVDPAEQSILDSVGHQRAFCSHVPVLRLLSYNALQRWNYAAVTGHTMVASAGTDFLKLNILLCSGA